MSINLNKTIMGDNIVSDIETPLRGLIGILDSLSISAEAQVTNSQELFELLKDIVENIIDNKITPIKDSVDYMFTKLCEEIER